MVLWTNRSADAEGILQAAAGVGAIFCGSLSISADYPKLCARAGHHRCWNVHCRAAGPLRWRLDAKAGAAAGTRVRAAAADGGLVRDPQVRRSMACQQRGGIVT